MINVLGTPVNHVLSNIACADLLVKRCFVLVPYRAKEFRIRVFIVRVRADVIIHAVLKARRIGVRHG